MRIPTEADLLAVMVRVSEKEIAPYEEDVSDLPLVEQPPAPGAVVSENTIPAMGVTEWALSNGVRVVMKPTDFQNDQVLFRSFSPGGHSLVSDEDYIAAATATAVVNESGLGAFNQIQLGKKLAGKVAGVSFGIEGLGEQVSGSASPEDLETMFQLIYLAFTAPRADSLAFRAFQTRIRGMLENRGARPETAFLDTLQVTLSRYHYRTRPWSEALLEEMGMQRSFEIYRERFADAGDFTFFFVGNFDPEQIKPLVLVYLGGLPSLKRKEVWKDVGIRPPEGVVEKTVRRGQEPKSQTRLVFTGSFEWDRKNRYALSSMRQAFQIKLQEVLREELGGTYDVWVSASRSHYPTARYTLSVSFGCDPERAEELTQMVFTQIDSLKQSGLPQSYIDKVKEMQRREDETDLKENRYWLSALQGAYYHGEDPLNILKYGELVDGLIPEIVKEAARQYFNLENYVKVVLMSEEGVAPQ